MKPEDYLDKEKNSNHKKIRKVQFDLALYTFYESKAKTLLYENLEFTPFMTEEVLGLFISKIHKYLEARDKVQQQSNHPLGKYAKNQPPVG